MNEARVVNFTLMGMFILMLFIYTFLANYVIYISGIETTSVSVFCG